MAGQVESGLIAGAKGCITKEALDKVWVVRLHVVLEVACLDQLAALGAGLLCALIMVLQVNLEGTRAGQNLGAHWALVRPLCRVMGLQDVVPES